MQRSAESTKRRGFTLMELLVVLAILVLLMAMVAPRVLKFLGKSDISVAKSQIGSLKKSLDLYAADCRRYPTTEQGGLQALINPPAMAETGGAVRGWDGPYLDGDSVPLDPWGLPYGYSYPPTRGSGPGPDIWSCGPDNMDGTEDDIVSWTVASTGTGEQGMMGQDPLGQDPLGQDPLGTGPMGGQLGPEGLPGSQPMGMQPGGQLPPMGGGTGPMGGTPPLGGNAPMGAPLGGNAPLGGSAPPGGNLPMGGAAPMGGASPMGGTGPMGGTTGPMPPGGGAQPRNF